MSTNEAKSSRGRKTESGTRNPGSRQNPLPLKEAGKRAFWLEKFHLSQADLFWDVGGLLLLLLALLTALGLLGLTEGALITPWISSIRRWFGYASLIVVFSLAALALGCFRHHFPNLRLPSLGKILFLEAGIFSLMAVLAVFGGLSLERAGAGLDGGMAGWGLATLALSLLPGAWGTLAIVVFTLFFLSAGTGLLGWSLRSLMTRMDSAAAPGAAAAATRIPAALPPAAKVESELPSPRPQRPEPGIQPLRMRDEELPSLDLLLEEPSQAPDEALIAETGRKIESTLADFGIPVHVLGYRMGPTITQYAVEPGFLEKPGPDGTPVQQKIRVSQISALQRDLALALKASRLRIEAPVPGRSYVGIEVPNPDTAIVRLRGVMESREFRSLNSPLAVAIGKDVSGQAVVADLARMPHLLIAGTTGSGKSICIAALVTCLAANNPPDRLRIALLDPKMVELVRFNGLPHLLGKVETGVERMLGVLRWAQMEMDQRYKLLENARSRDIDTYNRKAQKANEAGLPRIVILIDELADLMMSAPDQTEHALVRLAQMARAVGIHLVVATQRPSTDVITGLIKANFPARLAFTVASGIDSRVILDSTGAESLLGKGDLLWLNPEAGSAVRAQGVLVADQEAQAILDYWRARQEPGETQEAPWEEILAQGEEDGSDVLVRQAIEVVRHAGRASVSLLQRRLRVGFPRAARLIDQLEELGVVGPAMGSGRDREVLSEEEDMGDEDQDDYEDEIA